MAEDDVSFPRDSIILLIGAYTAALASSNPVVKDRALALTIHLLRLEDYVPEDYKGTFVAVVRAAIERAEIAQG